MEEWLAYSPRDFLLFSELTYWRLFERANAALWPLPLAAPALVAAALLAGRASLAFGVVAAGWVAVAAIFMPLYAEINWAMRGLLPAFWVEAALLAIVAFRPGLVRAGMRAEPATPRVRSGLGVALVAALGWPLLAPATGRPLAAAEVVGIAPDPTALATLGLLAAFGRGWRVMPLALLPAAWCLVGAVTLLTMGATAEGGLLLAALALSLVALALPARP